jgi:DNA polymerase-3 subunit alpha
MRFVTSPARSTYRCARVNELAKFIPDTLNIKLRDALEESPDLKAAYDSDPAARELLDYAIAVEGLARSAGTHAAGVVVADVPLDTVVPLQRITGKEDIITQWDGPTVESVGLLKMDFLGLRNLTILDKAVQNVKKIQPDFELEFVKNNLDDKVTFALLQRGETKGVFQLESGGMRDLLTKMKPDCFADIIATSALYRPGPLEGGMVMEYVDVKNGRKAPRQVHPVVDEILAETYGVMVYQEQVMRILNRVGNVELSSAYKCIKAISKKKEKTITGYYQEYIDGARSNGISDKIARRTLELHHRICRVWLQQVSLNSLRTDCLRNSLPEGPLSGSVHSRTAQLRNGEH